MEIREMQEEYLSLYMEMAFLTTLSLEKKEKEHSGILRKDIMSLSQARTVK